MCDINYLPAIEDYAQKCHSMRQGAVTKLREEGYIMENRGSFKLKLLAASAATVLALAGCTKQDDGTKSSDDDVQVTISDSKKLDLDLDGKSPLDKPFKLSGAEPLDVDGFITLLADEDDSSDFQYASSSFDSKSGATILQGVSTTDEDGTMTIGRLELYGVNDTYIQALKAGNISDTKDEIFRKVRMFDLEFVGAGDSDGSGTMTIGALEVDGLSFGGVNEDELEGMEDGAEFATIMKAFDLGGIYLKDLNLQGMESEGTGISATVADMRYGGFSGGNVGSMLFKNLDYTITQSTEAKAKLIAEADPQLAALLSGPLGNIVMPANQQASIESISWDGMSFAGMLPYLESGEQPPLDAKNLLSFGKIEAKNSEVFVNGKKASTTGYSALDPIEFAWLVPTRIRSYSKDTKMDLTAYVPDDQPEMMSLFQDNGLNNLTGDGEVLWTYDEKKGDAELDYDVDLTGFANIDLNFKASNAVLETLHTAASNGDDGAAFQEIAINGFNLRIDDEKLLDLAFGVAAMQTGQDAVQLRASAPLMINMGGAQFAQMNPAFPGYLNALSSWISSGGSLEISVDPDAPVSFADLAAQGQTAPESLPDVLKLSVTHSE